MDFSEIDGLYGSKHLAKEWSNSSSYLNKKSVGFVSELERIRLFVLLDLIGQTSPKFFTYSVSKILLIIPIRRFKTSPQFDGSERNLYYDIAMDIENSLEQLQPTNLTQMFTGKRMCKFLLINPAPNRYFLKPCKTKLNEPSQ